MTNPPEAQTVRGNATAATPGTSLVPPILVPILLTLMIAARAVYLVYFS